MCSPATKDVVEQGEFSQVTIADINLAKAREFAASLGLGSDAAVKVDAREKAQLVKLFRGYDVVVNGLHWLFAKNVLEAALEARVSACDLGSDPSKMLSYDDLAKEAKIAYGVGCGATPGVTNLMAKHGAAQMDKVEEIDISFAAMRSFGLSPALIETTLWEFDPNLKERAYYEGGKFHSVPPFSGERVVQFPPPIGPLPVYFVPHEETRSLPRNIKVDRVYVRGTFPPKVMRFVRSLIDYGFYREEPVEIAGVEIKPREMLKQYLLQVAEGNQEELWGYGLHVEVIGLEGGKRVKRTYWTTHPGMKEWGIPWAYSNNVGFPLSVAAHLLARGEILGYGVNCPEGLFDPGLFFKELEKRKIKIHQEREELD